jgi:glycerate kinase
VITGEGRIDAQSREGKLTGEIGRRCRAADIPCHAIAGEIALDPESESKLGFASLGAATSLESVAGTAERIAGRAS